MTLPDKILELLGDRYGIVHDEDQQVDGQITSLLHEKDVEATKLALDALSNNGLISRGRAKVELTKKGWSYVTLNSSTGGGDNGFKLAPADPNVVLRLGKRPTVGGRIVEAFLASAEAAVRIAGYEGKTQSLYQAVLGYVKKAGHEDRVEVRKAGGDVYLLLTTHEDVIEAKEGIGR